jgi:hypothetical protein
MGSRAFDGEGCSPAGLFLTIADAAFCLGGRAAEVVVHFENHARLLDALGICISRGLKLGQWKQRSPDLAGCWTAILPMPILHRLLHRSAFGLSRRGLRMCPGGSRHCDLSLGVCRCLATMRRLAAMSSGFTGILGRGLTRHPSTGEILMPSAWAVFRLTTNSIFVGCWMGISLALWPRGILSTHGETRRMSTSSSGP